MRRESPPFANVVNEQQPHAPPTSLADPHLELLQRVTNQLNELSVNMFQGSRVLAQPPNEERAQNAHHREGKSISATIVEKMGMVCISTLTQGGILEMARDEVPKDK